MAAAAKVLVIDDALTMRALISTALERIKGIEVVGTADGAEEARREIARLNPSVLTLDVEMPGMSGIEFLAEIMERRPMPVIMFSTLTEAGADASIEALRLGAVDCFPKPKVAKQGDFDAVLARIAGRIKTARTGRPRRMKPAGAGFVWNGRPLVVGTDAEGVQRLFDLVGALPETCPPVLVVQNLPAHLVDSLVAKLAAHSRAKVAKVTDQAPLLPGHVYVAAPGDAHVVIDRWPEGRLRFLPRDPVSGERPSMALAFASLAKAAGGDAVV